MKRLSLVLVAAALAAGCTDTPTRERAAQPITGPAAVVPDTITSKSIHVSATGSKSSVCGVYLSELDKAHGALVAAKGSQAAAQQVQLLASLATDACN